MIWKCLFVDFEKFVLYGKLHGGSFHRKTISERTKDCTVRFPNNLIYFEENKKKIAPSRT